MSPRPPGFTLVELLMVVVITAVIMAAVVQVLVSQQRGYRQQTTVVNARQSARTVLDIMAIELRELSAWDGDIVAAETNRIRFRSFHKVGYVCDSDPGGAWMMVLEEGGKAFGVNDSILAYLEEDNAWVGARIQEVEGANCGSAFARELRPGIGGVAAGAPVRGFEVLEYGVFEGDDEWMLVRRNADGEISSLVGPLAPPSEGGLDFRYIDFSGDELSRPLSAGARTQIARIAVSVRGKSRGAGTIAGEQIEDQSLQVKLRGN